MADLFQYADTRPRYPQTGAGYRDNATSRDAADAMQPRLAHLQEQVLFALDRNPKGLCAFELPDFCCPNTFAALQPRLTELAAMGKVEKTSERRTNPETGRSASVWKRRGF
tara:strand:- start:614 stop:946 length:333 start_codon:yes stop_codon:yes gene_type:complete